MQLLFILGLFGNIEANTHQKYLYSLNTTYQPQQQQISYSNGYTLTLNDGTDNEGGENQSTEDQGTSEKKQGFIKRMIKKRIDARGIIYSHPDFE